MRRITAILQFSTLVAGTAGALQPDCNAAASGDRSGFTSWLHDWGFLRSHTYPRYKTFCGPTPPEMETWHGEEPCDDGLLFVTSAGTQGEGPTILRTNGELVWTQSGWGRTSDLKVQNVGDRSYITFWHDEDSHSNGRGSYVVLDQSFQMVRELKPVGGISSRPLELKLTETGTAIVVMHNATQTNKPFGGLENGWINDAIIQEMAMASNELVFEWRASQHFPVDKSRADIEISGRTPETALDFFHATGIDLDHEGNYVISSRNMCNAAALRRQDGSLLWVLGGALNSFQDMATGGQAVAMGSSQGMQWHGDSVLVLLDGSGSVPGVKSNVRMIHLNTTTNRAVLMRTYDAPGAVASRHSSRGIVQVLRSGHVFIGWGDDNPSTAAYTEYSRDGRQLCAARLLRGPTTTTTTASSSSNRARVVSKYIWTGTPADKPTMAVRAEENAVYVSWNGDTETTTWLLQSNNTDRRDGSLGVRSVVKKTGFETRLAIPSDVGEAIQLVAVDASGRMLVHSELLWRQKQQQKQQAGGGGGEMWSTQRAEVQSSEDQDSANDDAAITAAAAAGWRQYTSAKEHWRLLLALAGLGLGVAVMAWCRWIVWLLWKMVLAEGGYQRRMVPKGGKGIV